MKTLAKIPAVMKTIRLIMIIVALMMLLVPSIGWKEAYCNLFHKHIG